MEEDDPDIVMNEIDSDSDIDMDGVDPNFETFSPAPPFPPGLYISPAGLSTRPDVPEVLMADNIAAVDIEMNESAGIAECAPAPGHDGQPNAAAISVVETEPITPAVASAGSDKGKAPETAGAPSLGSAISQDGRSWMFVYPRAPKPTAENPGYAIDSWYDTPKPVAITTSASSTDTTEEPLSLTEWAAIHYAGTPKPTVDHPGYTIDSWYDSPKLAATATFAPADETIEDTTGTADNSIVYSEPSDYTFGSEENTFVEGSDDVESEVTDLPDRKGGEQPSWLTVSEPTSGISLAGPSSAWSLVSSYTSRPLRSPFPWHGHGIMKTRFLLYIKNDWTNIFTIPRRLVTNGHGFYLLSLDFSIFRFLDFSILDFSISRFLIYTGSSFLLFSRFASSSSSLYPYFYLIHLSYGPRTRTLNRTLGSNLSLPHLLPHLFLDLFGLCLFFLTPMSLLHVLGLAGLCRPIPTSYGPEARLMSLNATRGLKILLMSSTIAILYLQQLLS